MSFVLSLTQMLVLLSLYVMLSILLSILVCAAASLFCACLVSVQVSAPSGRKIHAGTRHYAVLPLSLAVKPLQCAEGARHDLLPCPDCHNISQYGEKSMSN